MRRAVMALAMVALLAAAFWGGTVFAGSRTSGRADGPGGAFAQLSDAERQELQTMSDAERQAFFEEKGIDAPAGGPMGAPAVNGAAGGRPGGAGMVEGTVASISGEEVTVALESGGSTVVYVDGKTVTATAEGAEGGLAKGARVLVFAEPEADGVTTARAIVVR